MTDECFPHTSTKRSMSLMLNDRVVLTQQFKFLTSENNSVIGYVV